MKKWIMIVDVARCHDCNNCFLACKDEFVENGWPPYSLPQGAREQRWMNVLRKEGGGFPLVEVAYLPLTCQHCDDALCVRAAQDGAVYKREDGIVIIDPEKAKERREIVDACPYGAIFWNEDASVPQKCTLCAHLLDDGWAKPRCVQACPTDALAVRRVDDDELEKITEEQGLAVYRPDFGTRPRIYYRNLELFTHGFIAGSVALREQGECVEGARVALFRGDGLLAETTTNNYGDFRFHGIVEKSGVYRVTVEAQGFEMKTILVDFKQSANIGPIFL